MLVGAIIYGGGVEVSAVGIAFAVLNMCLAISDRMIQRRLLTAECKDLHSSVCTIMNNALGLIPALALSIFQHELTDAMSPEKRAVWSDPAVWFLLSISGGIGIG